MKKFSVLVFITLLFSNGFTGDSIYVGRNLGMVSTYYFYLPEGESLHIAKFKINKIGYSKVFEQKTKTESLKDTLIIWSNDTLCLKQKRGKNILVVNGKNIKLKPSTISELYKFENLSTVSKLSTVRVEKIREKCNLSNEAEVNFTSQISDYYLKSDNLQKNPSDFSKGFIEYLDQLLTKIDSTCYKSILEYSSPPLQNLIPPTLLRFIVGEEGSNR